MPRECVVLSLFVCFGRQLLCERLSFQPASCNPACSSEPLSDLHHDAALTLGGVFAWAYRNDVVCGALPFTSWRGAQREAVSDDGGCGSGERVLMRLSSPAVGWCAEGVS
jgi:hypothetical protein